MKWAKYFLCYLRGAVVRLLVLCSKAGSECYLRVAAKSTSLKWPEKAVQMKIFLNSKLSYLKEVIMSSGIFLVELLLLSVLVLCVSASCSAPRFPKLSSSPSQMHTEKEGPNYSLGSSHGQPAKTQSRYRVDTWHTWGKQPLWESSAFISGHRLTEDK